MDAEAMSAREVRFTFRPLSRADLPQMLAWLSDPDVARWYTADELSTDSMEEEFGSMIDGIEPVRGFIANIDGEPVGYIQCYRLGDHPDYLAQLDLDADDVSTDLFLGDPRYRNHGWGAPMLGCFLRQIVFADPAVMRATIMPNPGNARAISVYQKVGFEPVRALPIRDTDSGKIEDELIMLLPREDFFLSSG